MIVMLQTLLMLREGLAEWVAGWLRDAVVDAAVEAPSEEQTSAEYDEERGVVFYPPVYAQRYAAVSDLLRDPRWADKLQKVVDMGYCDLSFIKYLKEVSGVHTILGVDIEGSPLSKDLFQYEEYACAREDPLKVVLFQGNSADPDYRLIGCDAVVAIEMLEHMLPHDLERLVHNVFGFVKPLIAVFTTPNADFNVLFSKMLPNGMRHWDHKFEWTREQFNDWCSNIVVRYPQYSVWSRGVGPGPAGTEHLGCCTQLALFFNKEYQKQADLTPDTLAMITKLKPASQRSSQLCTNLESCDKPLPSDSNSKSTSTIIFQEPSESTPTLPANTVFTEGTAAAQCNLEAEAAKAYLMTCEDDNGPCLLSPCRKIPNRTYEIDDVNCRLNCSTVRVKRFSERSALLMDGRGRPEADESARELLGELRQLARALNLDRRTRSAGGGASAPWANINWGYDAPYWNQYYAIVKEYEYPFESKPSDIRLMDLVSDEIHRTVDMKEDLELLSLERGRLEIPIERLMSVVKHITTDVDRVKEMLEWNGYEVVGDAVVHARLVSDAGSRSPSPHADPEWDVNAKYSVSEVTTINQDSHARTPRSEDKLRRGIDRKVRRLRAALCSEADIASELASVVDKLTSLALRRASGRRHAARERWMQCKLYDLLTLSENAVTRRMRSPAVDMRCSTPVHEIDHYPKTHMSLSSIHTQKTSNDDLPRTPAEDEDRWLSGESQELGDSEITLHEQTVTISCLEKSDDSNTSTYNCTPICSPEMKQKRFPTIQVQTPIKGRIKLNRNLFPKSSIAKRIKPLPPEKRLGVLKILGLPRNSINLTSGLQCYHTKVERRQKKHKKKHGRMLLHHLKPSRPIHMAEHEMYEPMTGLEERAEGSDSSVSGKLNVIELSRIVDDFMDPDKAVHVQDYDSYTVLPNESVASSYIVADNKIYQTESKHALVHDYMQKNNGMNYSYDIFDLCEPSTSTGIRHMAPAVNVQCDVTTFTNPFFTTVSPTLSPYTQNCDSPGKLSQTTTSVTNLCVPNEIATKEVGVSAEYVPSKLNRKLEYGGVHLHCYKDKGSSEDIVFHGQWKHRASDSRKPSSKPPSLKIQVTRKYQKALLGKNPAPARSNVKKLVPSATERRRAYQNPMANKVDKPLNKLKKDSTSEKKITVSRFTSKPLTTFSQSSPFSTSPVSVNLNRNSLRNDTVCYPVSPETDEGKPNSKPKDNVKEGDELTNDCTTQAKGTNIYKMEEEPEIKSGIQYRLKNSPQRLNDSFSANQSSSSCCSPCSVVTVRNSSRATVASRLNILNKVENTTSQDVNDNVARLKTTTKKTKKVCQKSTHKVRDKENYSSCSQNQETLWSELINANEEESGLKTNRKQGQIPVISTESNESISKLVEDEKIMVKPAYNDEIITFSDVKESVKSRTHVENILKNIDSSMNTFALRDIFGRRDRAGPKNANALAAQTFSGYSVDYELPVDSTSVLQSLPSAYGSDNVTDMPGRLTASAEVYIPSPSSESFESCESAGPLVPLWMFRVISSQENSGVAVTAGAGAGEGASASAGGAEGAGAGDGRGVHTLPSTSDEYSSLGSADTDIGMREALNLDGLVGGVEVTVPGVDSDSSSSGANTWVRVEGELGRRTGVMVGRTASRQGCSSLGGAEADVSSAETDVPDG